MALWLASAESGAMLYAGPVFPPPGDVVVPSFPESLEQAPAARRSGRTIEVKAEIRIRGKVTVGTAALDVQR